MNHRKHTHIHTHIRGVDATSVQGEGRTATRQGCQAHCEPSKYVVKARGCFNNSPVFVNTGFTTFSQSEGCFVSRDTSSYLKHRTTSNSQQKQRQARARACTHCSSTNLDASMEGSSTEGDGATAAERWEVGTAASDVTGFIGIDAMGRAGTAALPGGITGAVSSVLGEGAAAVGAEERAVRGCRGDRTDTDLGEVALVPPRASTERDRPTPSTSSGSSYFLLTCKGGRGSDEGRMENATTAFLTRALRAAGTCTRTTGAIAASCRFVLGCFGGSSAVLRALWAGRGPADRADAGPVGVASGRGDRGLLDAVTRAPGVLDVKFSMRNGSIDCARA